MFISRNNDSNRDNNSDYNVLTNSSYDYSDANPASKGSAKTNY